MTPPEGTASAAPDRCRGRVSQRRGYNAQASCYSHGSVSRDKRAPRSARRERKVFFGHLLFDAPRLPRLSATPRREPAAQPRRCKESVSASSNHSSFSRNVSRRSRIRSSSRLPSGVPISNQVGLVRSSSSLWLSSMSMRSCGRPASFFISAMWGERPPARSDPGKPRARVHEPFLKRN